MAPEKSITTIENIYEELFTFDALLEANRHARKGKRYRDEVLRFTDNLEGNLLQLQKELLDGTYQVGPYRQFYVREPKLRLVMALSYRDRIVQWAIYQKLFPFYNKQFIEDSYACRKGKGSHRAADRLQYWLRQVDRKAGQRWYYLKLDISKYFYRVSHRKLEKILRRRIKDERLMELLIRIINSEDTAFGLPAGCSPEDCDPEDRVWETGMPIGNLTSQMFANIYLNELDQLCKHKLGTHFYVRYMDDIIILSDSKEQLHQWEEEIRRFLWEELELELNQKTTIRPISMGVDFVGFRIWTTHRRLKRSTARKIIRRFTGMCDLLKQGAMSREHFKRVTASWAGTMGHGDTKGLREKLNRIYIDKVLHRAA
jgi:retron-type reverse transcriptase